MFHRQFPDSTLSASHLQRFYHSNGIKFKVIKQKKMISRVEPERRLLLTKTMHDQVMQALE